MWLFTQTGFFSVVQKASDPGILKIRARVRADLEALVDRYGLIVEIVETKHRDYPYRFFLPREKFAHLMQRVAMDVDYTNFKSQVGKVQGHKRAHMYGKVWGVMHGAEKKLGGENHVQSQERLF
jgi:hypothetical protein